MEPEDTGEKSAAAARLAKAAEDAAAKVLNASPQARAARFIKRAAEYPCASEEARIAVANELQSFAHSAAELLNSGHCAGVDALIATADARIRTAADITPPRPALMPNGDAFRHFGWSSEERSGLETLLLFPLCG